MVHGWRWRQRQAMERDAWMLANLLQPWSHERLKAEHFLPLDPEQEALRARFQAALHRGA